MIPVVLDTDIGGNIDDHWALAFLLGCPELDLKLVTSCVGDTTYRAQLAVALLTAAGRTDVPIGIGRETSARRDFLPLSRRAAGHPVDRYPGTVHEDGVGALVATIMGSSEPITLITIGPATNIADALAREPAIAARTRLIAMAGFLRGGVRGAGAGAQRETNVVVDVPAFRRLLDADWRELVISPVDSCGHIILNEARYASILESRSPLLGELIATYREWYDAFPTGGDGSKEMDGQEPRPLPEHSTTRLYDTLPVFLAYSDGYTALEDVKVVLDDDGILSESAEGRPLRAATGWHDLEGYLDHLLDRLLAA